MANLRDIFKRRQGLNAITGYSGGSLQDQLDEPNPFAGPSVRREPIVQPDTSATRPRGNPQDDPSWIANINNNTSLGDETRPRTVTSAFDRFRRSLPAQPLSTDGQVNRNELPMRETIPLQEQTFAQERPRSTNPFLDRMMNDPSRQERPREVNPTDEVTKSADYVRQIHDKPLSLRDKFGLVAQNISQNLGGTPLATRRQRDLARAGEGLQRELAIDKQSILREQGQMVPFQLPDGTWTQVPAKTVGSLGSRQQNQQASLSLRRQQVEDHRKRWGQMGSHEAVQDAQRLYNSGAADDNDDLKDAIAVQMRLPAGMKLPNHDRGQLIVGGDGNYQLASPKTGLSTTVTDKTTGKPIGSWSAEQFQAAEKGRNDRANARNAQSERNSTIVAGGQVARMGDPAVHQNNIKEIDDDISEIDNEIKALTQKQQTEGLTREEADALKSKPREKKTLERERRDEREKLGKITSAQGNQSTRGSKGQRVSSENLNKVLGLP